MDGGAVSGLALAASSPPMGLSLLAWFAPWPLLRALGGRPWRARLSFLVLLPVAALAGRGRGRTAGLAVSAAALAAAFVFGEYRLRAFVALPAADAPPVLTVVSGHNLARDPLGEYLAASAVAEPAPLTIWPETAAPGYLADDPLAAQTVARAARARGWLL